MSRVTVVGGGISGLVAAIACAEGGQRVVLYEATSKLGGRARSTGPPFVANLGPHALYSDGWSWAWLRDRALLPPAVRFRLWRFRTRIDGKLTRLPVPLARAWPLVRGHAPIDFDFRTWAVERVGERPAEAAIGFLSLPTLDHDPGRLSAAFAQQVFRRAMRPQSVRYVVGGWSTLVEHLSSRAISLGVRLQTETMTDVLPEPPVIVATKLSAARRLLGDPELAWEGTRTALLDLGLPAGRGWPSAVLDLDQRVYAARYSASDPTLAPPSHELIQSCAGMRPGETLDAATERIRRVLTAGFPGWRERPVWSRRTAVDSASGALDLPGRTWRDRPAVSQGEGVFLAGDAVAAPGLLSEVAFSSAAEAASGALAFLGPGSASIGVER